MNECLTEGCTRSTYCKGLCTRCYGAQWRSKHPESVKRYARESWARKKAQKAQEAYERRFEGHQCNVGGDCGYQVEKGRKMCAAHRYRYQQYGDPLKGPPIRRRGPVTLGQPLQDLCDEFIREMRADPHMLADMVEQMQKKPAYRAMMKRRYQTVTEDAA